LSRISLLHPEPAIDVQATILLECEARRKDLNQSNASNPRNRWLGFLPMISLSAGRSSQRTSSGASMQSYFTLLLVQNLGMSDWNSVLDDFVGAAPGGLNVICRQDVKSSARYITRADGAVIVVTGDQSASGQSNPQLRQLSQFCRNFLKQGKPVVLVSTSSVRTTENTDEMASQFGIDIIRLNEGERSTNRIAYERIIELLALKRRGFAFIDQDGIRFRSESVRCFDRRTYPTPEEQYFELVG